MRRECTVCRQGQNCVHEGRDLRAQGWRRVFSLAADGPRVIGCRRFCGQRRKEKNSLRTKAALRLSLKFRGKSSRLHASSRRFLPTWQFCM